MQCRLRGSARQRAARVSTLSYECGNGGRLASDDGSLEETLKLRAALRRQSSVWGCNGGKEQVRAPATKLVRGRVARSAGEE